MIIIQNMNNTTREYDPRVSLEFIGQWSKESRQVEQSTEVTLMLLSIAATAARLAAGYDVS